MKLKTNQNFTQRQEQKLKIKIIRIKFYISINQRTTLRFCMANAIF
jgi:hypothetical protein